MRGRFDERLRGLRDLTMPHDSQDPAGTWAVLHMSLLHNSLANADAALVVEVFKLWSHDGTPILGRITLPNAVNHGVDSRI